MCDSGWLAFDFQYMYGVSMLNDYCSIFWKEQTMQYTLKLKPDMDTGMCFQSWSFSVWELGWLWSLPSVIWRWHRTRTSMEWEVLDHVYDSLPKKIDSGGITIRQCKAAINCLECIHTMEMRLQLLQSVITQQPFWQSYHPGIRLLIRSWTRAS